MKSVGEAMAIDRTFKESLQKCLRSLEIGRSGLGGDGKPRRIGTEVYGNPRCKICFTSSLTPALSRSHGRGPGGEGTAVVRLLIARHASANRRLTTLHETDERFSFSPGEKAGMRASVEYTLFLVQQTTVTPYFSNCSSLVTTVKSCSLAAAMMKRSKGSSWIGGNFAAAMQTSRPRGRTVSP